MSRADSPVARAQTILHMLDYVAVDYPEAVKDGRVADAGEYQEQVDFVTRAIARLGELPARPGQAALLRRRATSWRSPKARNRRRTSRGWRPRCAAP